MREIISENKLREFGILMGLAIPLIIGFLLPLFFGHSFRLWTVFLGIIFLFFGIFIPKLLLYPYKFWISFGNILGWVNSRLILGIVYIVILLPIAFFMRLFGHDPLRKSFTLDHKGTYREKRVFKKTDLTRIF